MSGAPLAHWVGFPAAAVVWTGERAVRPGGRGVERSSCGQCASSLTYADATIEGELVYLAGGAFDRPQDVPPERHSFWGSRVSWLAVGDDLPKFETFSMPRQGGPTPMPLSR